MLRKDFSLSVILQFLFLALAVIFFTNSSWAADLNISVETSKGRALTSLNVYAFTEADSYTGLNSSTDSSGVATFDSDDFTAGNYKFRIDYLGNQFWSQVITIPDTLSASVIIEEETVEITVTTSAGPAQGVNVYLFTGAGSYMGLNETTDSEGKAAFELPVGKEFKFRADIMGSQYWSDPVTVQTGGTNYISIDAGGGNLQVVVEKSAGVPMEGINTYLFTASGSYLGQTQVTDSSGLVQYAVPSGDYKVRADYLGVQFWSSDTTVTADTNTSITIPHQDVTITVNGSFQGTNDPIESIPVYLFTSSGSYMSQNQVTDANGQVIFNLPEQPYKVRADYMGQQFWSNDFTWTDTTVSVPMADVEITVTGASLPLEGVNVYVFTSSGSYLGVNGATDADGNITFRLPAGSYDFRADYQGSQYWAEDETLLADQVNPVSISTGGGIFELSVFKGASDPLTGVNCYVFTEGGSYLGMNATTDANGLVSFSLADGTYKFRVDYLGVQFWTNVYEIPTTLSDNFTIPHQDVTITVNGTFQGSDDPIENINVYLFTSSGSYMSQNQTTDANGQVTFNLPEQPYKVRADYMGQQFWSNDFTWTDTTVSVPMADVEITVTGASLPLEGVNVYVFTSSGSYLGVNEATDADGNITFRLPAGTYDFRADYQGSQYWAEDETLLADQVNPVSISTGGGIFELTVLKGASDPLTGVNCYVFTEGGSYLRMNATTDANGQVSFSLADGTYKFRLDYLGVQFWTNVYEIPTTLSDTFTIPHQDVTITVEESYQGSSNPIEGITVYLFTPSGSYMSRNQVTNTSGQVTFNLPEQPYKVRADYLGQQFWSNDFTWTDTTIPIPHGLAHVHVTRSGDDLEGAAVYLFTETQSYLSRNDTTNTTGEVEFLIPAGSYTFRADEGGDQRWSDVTAITSDVVTNVDMEMEDLPPIVSISANPDTIQSGLTTTLTWSSTNAESVTIEPGLGSVDLSGTTTVSPTETTTYSITAIGPYGTATDNVMITVTYPAPTVNISADPEIIPEGGSSTLTWNSTNADSVSIDQSIGIVELSGSTTVSPTETATYTMTATGPGGTVTDSATVTINQAPSITILEPDGVDDTSEGSFTIQWADEDPDSGATISLYYDTDNSGIDGTLIIEGLSEDDDGAGGDEYTWDTSALGAGDYYVYALIDDGINAPVMAYSNGFITIGQTMPDEFKLTASDAEEYDRFGSAVDITEELAIIGAENKNAAYLYRKEGDYWIEEAKLVSSDVQEDDEFGNSVTINGDYAVVGARCDDDCSGAAYVFKYENSAWTEMTKLTASDAGPEEGFGWSIDLEGDLIIIGCPFKPDGFGSVYIFKRDGDNWVEQTQISTSDPFTSLFGNSISINGDYIIIGDEYANEDESGAAYIFKREGDNWVEQAKLIASDASEEVAFGTAVSISGDYAIVGARYSIQFNSGAAYIFKLDGENWIEQTILAASDSVEYGGFGCSVSIDGDYTIVGAKYGNEDESGAAYIFKREGETWNELVKLTASDAEEEDMFGYTTSIEGRYVIVGSRYGNTDLINDTGAAYIYQIPGYAPLPEVSLNADQDSTISGDPVTLTWTSSNADSVSIDQGIGPVNLNGSITVYPVETTTYTITAIGQGGIETDNVTVSVNSAPSITIIEPDGLDDSVNSYFMIRWTDFDVDDDAVIALYYDNDNTGTDGTLIVSGLSEDSDEDGDQYLWNISGVPDGDYYIYALIDDGVNIPVTDYSEGIVSLKRNILNEINLPYLGSTKGYGSSVDVDGDFCIVGHRNENIIYVYDTNGNGIAELGSRGMSVAISGDHILGGNYTGAYSYIYEDSSWDEENSFDGGYVAIDGNSAIIGAYIYQYDGLNWNEQANLQVGGAFVSISGDYAIQGSTVFHYDGASWVEQAVLPYGGSRDGFTDGNVSIHGDYVILGDPWDNRAHIFKRNGIDWILEQTLTEADGTFGNSAAIHGDYAIVGAMRDGEVGEWNGAAYIYKRSGSIWKKLVKIIPGDSQIGDWFGRSVGIDGNHAIVGGFCEDFGLGKAYLYTLPHTVIAADPQVITQGTSTTLLWNCNDATSVTIDNGVGTFSAPEGSAVVSPTETTTYIITAQYPWGTETDSVTVAVCETAVNLSADFETICITEPVTLTWNSTNASSCIIEPGIGEVGPSGTTVVTPMADTVYTIRATGIGDCEEVEVEESASVTLDPYCDNDGDGLPDLYEWENCTTFEWGANDDPDEDGLLNIDEYQAGTNPCNPDTDGDQMPDNWEVQHNLNPLADDSAEDFDGDGVSNYDEYVLGTDPTVPVFVNMTASPDSIFIGNSSTLSWNSVNADSVTIDQGIGSVDLNGTITVSPTETTTYNITAEGPLGTETFTATVTVIRIMISISEPSNGETISRPDTMVRGTINNPLGLEVGVNVNGVVALVEGDQFVANHVPMEEGENSITANAISSEEDITSDTVNINGVTTGDYITLTTDTESGISPLEIVLSIEGSFGILEEPLITYIGPGTVDILPGEEENKYNVSITTEGLYFFTAELDQGGVVYTDSLAVLVMNVQEMDGLLQAKWNGMKNALIDGDVGGALNYFYETSKEEYQEIFEFLAPRLPTIASEMREIELIYIGDNVAKYRIKKEEILQGQTYDISYFVYFHKGQDGVWKIESY